MEYILHKTHMELEQYSHFFFVASKEGEYWVLTIEHESEVGKHSDISSGKGKSNDISGKEILPFVWQHISHKHILPKLLAIVQSRSSMRYFHHMHGVREDSLQKSIENPIRH